MRLPFFILLLSIVFFFGGCGMKQYAHKRSAYIVMKTPAIKYADMGFIYSDEREVKAQIYKLATPVLTLKLGKKACMEGFCYDYGVFNRKYLHPGYPKETIRQIFLGRELMQSRGKSGTGEGFVQEISDADFDILYSVTKDMVRFHDRKNNILIKIRNIE